MGAWAQQMYWECRWLIVSATGCPRPVEGCKEPETCSRSCARRHSFRKMKSRTYCVWMVLALCLLGLMAAEATGPALGESAYRSDRPDAAVMCSKVAGGGSAGPSICSMRDLQQHYVHYLLSLPLGRDRMLITLHHHTVVDIYHDQHSILYVHTTTQPLPEAPLLLLQWVVKTRTASS